MQIQKETQSTNNAYLNVLKNSKMKKVKMINSERRDALKKQNNLCASCKKSLNPSYMSFKKNPDGSWIALCSTCYYKAVHK